MSDAPDTSRARCYVCGSAVPEGESLRLALPGLVVDSCRLCHATHTHALAAGTRRRVALWLAAAALVILAGLAA